VALFRYNRWSDEGDGVSGGGERRLRNMRFCNSRRFCDSLRNYGLRGTRRRRISRRGSRSKRIEHSIEMTSLRAFWYNFSWFLVTACFECFCRKEVVPFIAAKNSVTNTGGTMIANKNRRPDTNEKIAAKNTAINTAQRNEDRTRLREKDRGGGERESGLSYKDKLNRLSIAYRD
jgi:hypothetical protein